MSIGHRIIGIAVEPIRQQPPPFNPFSEIYRPFHSFHAFLLQPFAALIKKHKCGFFIINALEKAHLSYRIMIQTASLSVYKSRNPSDNLPLIIL